MTRVVCYVDGFNLYHAIDDLNKPHLKWVDLDSLAKSLCRDGEMLVGVHYFSAYATWLAGSYARHRTYVSALRSRGVICHMARFNEKKRTCKSCGASWISREEKETDVHFAITFTEHAIDDVFDRAIIISADGDYTPAIRRVRQRCPAKEIFVGIPPGRHGRAREIGKAANSSMEITAGRVGRNLFAKSVLNADGSLAAQRPVHYDPPPGWRPPI